MRAQTQSADTDIPIDRVDFEALDRFLTSDRSPSESMMLSELDGFLTGIVAGPEMVMPSEWLPLVFGGEWPKFAGEAEAKTVLGAIMGRYNEILRQIADDRLDPVFWVDRDGTLIAADWAKGFLEAIVLRPDAWDPLFFSKRESMILLPILALCGDKNGESLLDIPPDEEDHIMEEAAKIIPECVVAIANYWRAKNRKNASASFISGASHQPAHAASKVGRNDPCPCGSDKKFKKCCGKAA